MEYMTQAELTRVMTVGMRENELHWQAMLTAFYFGLRVSEVIGILGEDVEDGQLRVKRLKRSEATLQKLPKTDGSPVFELRLATLALKAGPRGRVFPLSRQRCDQFMKRYCRLAGLHRAKAHFHCYKHSIAMAIWQRTHQPGQIKAYLGHKSMSSTMQYLNESDSLQAQAAVSALGF
jgi:integrase